MKLPTLRIFWINFITSFYGLFLPGAIAGGAIRWYKYARVENKPLEAAATVAFARLLNALVAVALGGLCWSLDASARGRADIGAALGVALIVLAFIHWLFFHQIHAAQLAGKLEARIRLPAVVRAKLPRMLRAAAAFRGLSGPKLILVLWMLLLCHLLQHPSRPAARRSGRSGRRFAAGTAGGPPRGRRSLRRRSPSRP